MLQTVVRLPAAAVQLVMACAACSATAQTAPPQNAYAGQHTRAIKALSEQEVNDLLSGRGSGLAKAAELNGYPGPAHVLELKGRLALTDAQLAATEALMDRHRAAARRLGKELVAAERSLDHAFASRTATDDAVQSLTAAVARLQGELRAEHLKTHLAQTVLLTPEQVARYVRLRGYASVPRTPQGQHRH